MSSTRNRPQPSQAGRIKRLEDRLRKLETRKVLPNAAITTGGIVVNGDGSIAVNKDGTGVELHVTEMFDILSGVVDFVSSDETVADTPARIVLLDQGAGSVLHLQSIPTTAGHSSTLALAGNGGATLLAGGAGDGNDTSLELVAAPLGGGPTIYVSVGTSGSWEIRPAGIASISGHVQWDATTGTEWRAKNDGGSAYVPVRASSFPTSSSREVKEAIAEIPFDAVAAVAAAKAQQWRYKPDFAIEDVAHISPMAEDLPPALVQEVDGVKSVDLLSLVGVLWDAVGTLSARVAALEADRT